MEGTIKRSAARRQKTSSTGIFASGYNNILFICGGAFAGLEKVIESRGKGTSIGFGSEKY